MEGKQGRSKVAQQCLWRRLACARRAARVAAAVICAAFSSPVRCCASPLPSLAWGRGQGEERRVGQGGWDGQRTVRVCARFACTMPGYNAVNRILLYHSLPTSSAARPLLLPPWREDPPPLPPYS
jgi:hypothetical protein